MNRRRIFLALIAALSFTLLLSTQVKAQRIYDEFDAPVINEGKLYKDYSISPLSFASRYNGPMLVSNVVYNELTENGPDRVKMIPPAKGSPAADAGYLQAQLPFTIQYNGTTYPAGTGYLWISVNGFVIVNTSPVAPGYVGNSSSDLFANVLPSNIIAPYWGNHLYQTDVVGKESDISWQVFGAAPKRKIVIQWKNLSVNIKGNAATDNAALANFQVILWERQIPTNAGQPQLNTQNDIDFSYGPFGGNGPVDPTYYNGASVGLKGANGEYLNGLSYINPNLATTSTALTSGWVPSGTVSSIIRFEAYQKSLAINPIWFESRFIPQVNGFRTDRDDGFYRVDLSSLNFDFNFQGIKQPSIWINVNGFATFQNPDVFSSIANDQANGLFLYSSSYPNNVIAPFWGDHYLRVPGEQATPSSNGQYLGSEISYLVLGSYPNRRLIVQWKNLNIMDETLPSSVGNFQAILYEGVDDRFPNNFAGGVEFAYGDVGGNTFTPLTTVSYKNASVGLKGSASGLFLIKSDFINGLTYDNIQTAFTSEQLTQNWRPSSGTNNGEGRRIFFRAIPRSASPGWGDGDADLSQIRVRKHAAMIQNRFVTVNDSRLIMRWLIQDKSLPDSLRKDTLRLGNNYHADVNHNGRYYYSSRTLDNLRDTILWRRAIDVDTFGVRKRRDSVESLAGLPPDAGPLRLIYYEANAKDASDILMYISARIPSLPWIWDTLGIFGKATIGTKPADNIKLNTYTTLANNIYKIPVYLNGTANGISAEFTVDGKVLDVETIENQSNTIVADHNDSKIVIAASGEFNEIDPIAYVTVETQNGVLNTSTVEFNERRQNAQSLTLEEKDLAVTGVISTFPNPFSSSTKLEFNIPTDGFYTIDIVDVVGKDVKAIFNGNSKSGSMSFEWNGYDNNGQSLNNGVYFVRLKGNNQIYTQKISIVK
ncbi:MAG: T9SS type A sorting domain-containing protein [Ignavibacteriae bacterium]|nr:T9SS type A sorting domain-containing protein [Ignavibacteriota bacterium]